MSDNFTERHFAMVEISFELLFDLMKVGWNTRGKTLECIEGLPPDAVFVASYTNNYTGIASLLFSHPSFKEVKLGEKYPFIHVVHKSIYPERSE